VSRYQVGQRVLVECRCTGVRATTTGVVKRLPVGESPWYIVQPVDGCDELLLPLDEIRGEAPPVDPSPAEMVAWLRS
jgi:hypothetical protein